MTTNILDSQIKTVLIANHQCEFQLFNNDDLDAEKESDIVIGYCVLEEDGHKSHYICINQEAQGYTDLLNHFPPCEIIGSTIFMAFNQIDNKLVECCSLDQYTLATSSWCGVISPLSSI